MHLEQTIRSVLDQTYQPIEYFIIDGGSTDNTVGIIRKYASYIAGWISEPDKGISDAFNKGIAMAHGILIGLINADDWYEKDTVEKIVAAIDDHHIAYGDLQYWKDGKKMFVQQGNHALLKKEMTVNHPTVFVAKRCYDQLGGFNVDYRYAMDYDVLLRFHLHGFSFVRIPFVLANMRWEGVSDKQWKKGCEETLAIKNIYFPAKKILNRTYYYKHVAAIGLSKFADRIGLRAFTRLYRNHFSKQKKIY